MKLNIQILGPPGRKRSRHSCLVSLRSGLVRKSCRTKARQMQHALKPESPILRLGIYHTIFLSLKPLAMVSLAFASAGASTSIYSSKITRSFPVTAHSPPFGRSGSPPGGMTPPEARYRQLNEYSTGPPIKTNLRHYRFFGNPPRFDQGRAPPRAILQTPNWVQTQ